MPQDQVYSIVLSLRDVIGDQIAAAYTGEGFADADARVWSKAAPDDVTYPYTVIESRQSRSTFIRKGRLQKDPVRGVITARTYSTNDVQVDEVAGAILEALLDASDVPSIPNFRLVWHDLLFHEPIDEIRQDAQNIYGRVLEVEYHLSPTV